MNDLLEQDLEKLPNVGYTGLSHLINLLSLVGYLVSGIWALRTAWMPRFIRLKIIWLAASLISNLNRHFKLR